MWWIHWFTSAPTENVFDVCLVSLLRCVYNLRQIFLHFSSCDYVSLSDICMCVFYFYCILIYLEYQRNLSRMTACQSLFPISFILCINQSCSWLFSSVLHVCEYHEPPPEGRLFQWETGSLSRITSSLAEEDSERKFVNCCCFVFSFVLSYSLDKKKKKRESLCPLYVRQQDATISLSKGRK